MKNRLASSATGPVSQSLHTTKPASRSAAGTRDSSGLCVCSRPQGPLSIHDQEVVPKPDPEPADHPAGLVPRLVLLEPNLCGSPSLPYVGRRLASAGSGVGLLHDLLVVRCRVEFDDVALVSAVGCSGGLGHAVPLFECKWAGRMPPLPSKSRTGTQYLKRSARMREGILGKSFWLNRLSEYEERHFGGGQTKLESAR